MQIFQSLAGPDPAVAKVKTIGTSGFQVFVEEEQSLDTEVEHIAEDTGYLEFDDGILVDDSVVSFGEFGSLFTEADIVVTKNSKGTVNLKLTHRLHGA